MMGFDGWGMGGAGWIVMLVFWLALIALVVWGLTRLLPGSGTRGADRPRETPEEILDRRFASGEIDAQTYRDSRAELAARRAESR